MIKDDDPETSPPIEVGRTDDLLGLARLAETELAHQVYEDVAQGPLTELGGAVTDVVHGLRLLTAPFVLMGAWHDRLVQYAEKVRSRVPIERQMEASAVIAGPIIERLRFLEPDDLLTELYLNLLARAIDKERVDEAHPAFVSLVGQLSPDEALIIFRLNESERHAVDTMDWHPNEDQFSSPVIETMEFPLEELAFPQNLNMYMHHLQSLAVLSWNQVGHQEILRDENGIQTGVRRKSVMQLTNFGNLFAAACMPEGAPVPRANETAS